MPNIGSLTVELDLQTAQYEAGLKRSKAQIVEHADSLTALQRSASSASNSMTTASDEIVAAWGKSGQAAQDAIKKMESASRNSAVTSGIREMRTATDRIVDGWGKVGSSGQDASKKLEGSMVELHVALKSVEQMIGVHIPKALEHLILESETMRVALAAGFSVIGVLGFISIVQQLPELYKKLEGAVTGWNEAAKKAFEQQIDLNRQLQAMARARAADELAFVEAEAKRQQETQKGQSEEIGRREKLADAIKGLGGVLGPVYAKIADLFRTVPDSRLNEEFQKTTKSANELSNEVTKLKDNLAKETESWFKDKQKEVEDLRRSVAEAAAKILQAFQDALNPAAALNKEMGNIGSTIKGISQEFLNPKGLLQIGNLDLLTRPLVKNLDGSISTVRSLSTSFEGLGEVLIPTVSELGMLMDEAEAIAEFQRTGKHLGIFDTPEHATAYALALHKQQEALYGTLAVNEKYNDVIAVYAEKIVAAAKLTKEHGKEVTGLTAVLLPGATAYLEYNKALNAYIEAQVKAAAIVRENKPQPLNAPLGGLPTVFTTPGTFPLPTTPVAPIDTSQLTQASVALQDLFTKMQQTKDATKDLSEEIRVLSSIGYDDSQIMGMLGDELSNAAKFSKELGITLPENVQHLLDALNAIKQQEISREFASRMTRDFATFVDHIGNDFQNVWRSFESLGINAIDSITSYAKKMKDAGNSVGGILGFIGNNSTLITAGIGALDLGLSIGRKVGQGRNEADIFGANVLKPFQDQVGGILNLLQQSAKAGTLTTQTLTQAQDNFEKGWQNVIDAAAKTNTAVGRQAVATLTPIVERWRVAIGGFANSALEADQATAALTAQLDALSKQQQAIADTTANVIDKIVNPAGDLKSMEGALQNLAGINQAQIIGAVGDDIRRIGDALTAASRPIPPMIADLYNFIKAQDAVAEAAARNTEIQQAQMQALAEEAQAFAQETQSIIDRITRPAGDTRALEAALTSVGGMDRAQIIAAIGDEIKRVGDAMTKAGQSIPPVIRDLYDFAKAQDEISEATSRIIDINKELTGVYDDLGTALNRQLDKLDTEKQSLQQQIVDAENDAARSQLQDTLDTTSSLGEYIRTQASLNELDRKIKADKKKAELEDIQRMKDRLAAVTALQDVTNSALDSLGFQREHENDLMDSSITSLIQRGSALEDERKMLAKVTGATEMVTSAFDALLAVFYPFMEPITLKSYQHGTDFVPSTGAYLLHQGESVTPAGQKPKGGGDVTVNFNAPVIGDMDELVDRLSPALLEAHRYDVQYGSQRPAIRQRAARSNRW